MTPLMEHLRQTAEAERAERDTEHERNRAEHAEGVIAGVRKTVMAQVDEWYGGELPDDELNAVVGHGLVFQADEDWRHVDVSLGDGLTIRVFSPGRGAHPRDWGTTRCAPVKLCPYCGTYVLPTNFGPRGLWTAAQVLDALEQPIPEHDHGDNERCDGTSSWLKLPPEPKRRHRVALVLTPEAIEDTINSLAADGYFTPAGVTPTGDGGTLIVGTYDPNLAERMGAEAFTDEEPF